MDATSSFERKRKPMVLDQASFAASALYPSSLACETHALRLGKGKGRLVSCILLGLAVAHDTPVA